MKNPIAFIRAKPLRFALRLFLYAGAAMVVALMATIYFWRPSPPDELASVEDLVSQLDRAAFKAGQRDHATKWIVPVRIALRGEEAADWRPVVEEHAAALATLTGLSIRLLDAPDDTANLHLDFVGHRQFFSRALLYDDRTDRKLLWDQADENHGMTIVMPMTATRIAEAAVIVTTDHTEDFVATAIRHHLIHAMGMLFHAEDARPTLMGFDYSVTDMSRNDRVVLRAYYDESIAPGMPRDDVLGLARAIVSDRVAAIR